MNYFKMTPQEIADKQLNICAEWIAFNLQPTQQRPTNQQIQRMKKECKLKLRMTKEQVTRIIEAIETLVEETEVEGKQIIDCLTGFCWNEEDGFRIEERLSMGGG